jgi:hypothetical protein
MLTDTLFQSHYQSTLVNLDLSVIVHERDQCLEAIKASPNLTIYFPFP